MIPEPTPTPLMPDGPLSRWLLDPSGFNRSILDTAGRLVSNAVPFLLIAIAASALFFTLIAFARWARDRRITVGGRSYEILPPPLVYPEGAETLWMGLHALLRPAWKRLLFGQSHLTWEIHSSEDGSSINMWVPPSVPPGLVERMVESSWAGATVITSSMERLATRGPVASCELVLAEPDAFPIGEGAGRDPLRPILGALGLLEAEERAVVQLLARPVTAGGKYRLRAAARRLRRSHNAPLAMRAKTRVPTPPPDPALDNDIRLILSKAAYPLWEVVIRIALSSSDRGAARGKIHAVAGAFAVFEGRNWFRRRRMRGGVTALSSRRMRRGNLLSVPELARLARLPGADSLPSLGRARAKTVLPPKKLPSDGKVLGIADHPGRTRPVAITPEDACHHVHLIGETGTGKSTLIANMVLGDAEAGRGAVVIDPKGDLVRVIVERLPQSAIGRTCLLDPDDLDMAVGLNVLAGDDVDLVVDHIVSVFKRIYEGSWGPRSDDIMRAACLTLAFLKDATLAEIPLLLNSKELRAAVRSRDEIFKHAGDLRGFWDWYEDLGEQQRAHNTAPLMNKLRAFLLRGHVRSIVGQAHPKLDIPALLENGGLLLVRIPKGTLGEETSRILGAFVVARVWQAAMRRAERVESNRKPIGLYVDEMHNYLALPRSFEDMLGKLEGMGCLLY